MVDNENRQQEKVGSFTEKPSQKSGLIETFETRLKRSRDEYAEWRKDCKTWYRMYEGDAWDPPDREAMREEKRIPVTFNYALTVINALVGADMADRREARVKGVDGSLHDEAQGEWLTEIRRHIYRKSGGHRQESQAKLDQLITGYGWCEVFVDSSRYPFRVRPKYVPAVRMYPDPHCFDDNVGDARYIICESRWNKSDAKARWPEKKADIERLSTVSSKSSGGAGVFPRTVKRPNHYEGAEVQSRTTMSKADDDGIEVYDYQFRRRERWCVWINPETGEREKAPWDEWQERKKELESALGPDGMPLYDEIEWTDYDREVYYRGYLAGAEHGWVVLQEPKRMKIDRFSYRCATAFRAIDSDTGYVKHFGLMALVEEPQRWSAKALSTLLEMMAKNSKGGGFIKEGVLLDKEKFEKEQGIPGVFHLVEDAAELDADIKERPPMPWPRSMDRLIDLAVQSIPEITAVTEWIKGTADSERSNVLISNLQQQSMVVLGPLMDPFSQFQVELAELTLRMAQLYMSPESINRVIENEKAMVEGLTYQEQQDPKTGEVVQVPITVQSNGQQRPITPADILRDADILEFDTAVDLGHASVTAKQAMWQLFNQTGLLQKLVEVGFPMQELFPWLIKNMPGIPSETAKEIANKVQSQMEAKESQQDFEQMAEGIQQMPPEALKQLAGIISETLERYRQQEQGQSPRAQGRQPQPSRQPQ